MKPLALAAAIAVVGRAALVAQAPAVPTSPPTQRLRVAVADLSGSALKMQTSTVPIAAPGAPAAAPPGSGTQQNVTVSLPAPAEFARGLTEMLTSVLVKTGRFTVLERAAMQQIDAEQR